MTLTVYPTWDEIKHELSKDDLFCILDDTDERMSIKEAIDEFILANYEPSYERDIDFEIKERKENVTNED